ncbi:MAG TPA: hypothetical protein VFN65_08815 [Solirubrobacteraceae bacterium]|nr:hypothetical protein [Solirubrobacteraceae bacterium]
MSDPPLRVAGPTFRLVCLPAALGEAPPRWAMLGEGELALLPGDGGLEDVAEIAHRLDLVSIELLRGEASATAQEDTVITFAGTLPLVWVAPEFSPRARGWAERRGAMTLLVEARGALPGEELRRIERFVASLGRQSE